MIVSLSPRDKPVSAGPAETSPIVPITSRYWALDHVSFGVEPGQMAALVGPSDTIPIVGGQLGLGTWQQIVLLDFDDRPRERIVSVQVLS